MSKGGKGGSKVDYKSSPEQRKLYDLAYNASNYLYKSAKGGEVLWDIPDMPNMSPTGDWWENLDPNIRAGINAPVMDMANQMGEQFGGQGMMGSPLTGSTGAFGGALGESVGKSWGPQAAMTGWNMMQPQRQADMSNWQAQLQSNQAPWNMLPSYLGQGNQSTPQPVVSQGSNPWSSAASGGLFGGMMGAGTALGGPLGAGLGAGMGYLGGK